MIDHIQAMIWKEWKEMLVQRDRSPTDRALRTAVAMIVFGILVWRVGLAFVDRPGILLMPAFILVFCVIAIVADSFAGERERNGVPSDPGLRLNLLLARVTVGVMYGWVSPLAMMALGFVLIAWSNRIFMS